VAHGTEGDRTRGESLSATADARPDVQSETQEFRLALQRELKVFEKTLKGRDIEIFHDRLIAEDGKTLMEIADRFGVSRERVRQIRGPPEEETAPAPARIAGRRRPR